MTMMILYDEGDGVNDCNADDDKDDDGDGESHVDLDLGMAHGTVEKRHFSGSFLNEPLII